MDDMLKYLAEVVAEWPNETHTHVRVDKSGEVCFEGFNTLSDFYPMREFTGSWSPEDGLTVTGHQYTFPSHDRRRLGRQ